MNIETVNGAPAMPEFCMFAEGTRFEKEPGTVGPGTRPGHRCRDRGGSGPTIRVPFRRSV